MSSQNPVFIPRPTNISERLRHAVFQGALEAVRNHDIKALLVPQNDTATGVRSAVAAAREYYRDTVSTRSKAP
ncbi:MAG: hypothetical protein L0H63_03305 [Nitrococcus sp.]|nr:hypothetical protein [Nitrococcus sp.]